MTDKTNVYFAENFISLCLFTHIVKDNFGRETTSIRVSVTQKCNLNCFYCHREGENSSKEEMTPEEIEGIVKIAKKLGIYKIKLTGGEPLLRNDIIEITNRVSKYMQDISMTTNGVLLEEFAKDLKKNGLKRVNISFDTLNKDNYKRITNKNYLKNVIFSIEEAKKIGLSPIKLNMVVMKDINENEIYDLIKFSSKNSLILQLIELENVENSNLKFYEKYHYELKNIEKELKNKAVKILNRSMQNRKKYFIPNGNNFAEVEVIRGMHNTLFCKNCKRIRITTDGKIKPCLLRNDNLVDILSLIRNGKDEKMLIDIFKKAILLREPYWR